MNNILKWFSTLALAATTAVAAEPLLLQWGTIDTSGSAAQAASAALKAKVAKKAAQARARKSAAPEERAAYIVQFPGPVTEEWSTWLEASTQVRGYLPEFAYLVWATATEMETIAANPDVFWTGEWKKDYKTVLAGSASHAKTTASASAGEVRWMQVGSFLTGDDGAADLRARLEALPAEVQDAFPRLDGSSAVALLTDAQIDEVASWPDVEWIEPKLKPRLFNDKAALTNMMNVATARESLSSGGLGLTGAGQIVAVADTGCDKGSTNDIHADFAGRIVAGYGWTNGAYKSSASWADLDAHGTHVCGSILGSGAASTNLYRGMAYEAQLVMQGMWEDLGGLPNHTATMLKQAYSAGARIHSDSWGYGTNYAGAYVYDSVYSDGYMWTNQNFIMVIAAGNDGIDADSDGVIDAGSVTAPGTAKNCICVGAAENYRTTGGYAASTYGKKWSSDYPADPIKSDKISQTNTPQGIVAFSARGPTLDGRFKPDIVAPGTDIISVRSRASDDTGWGLNSANTNYIYMGGTSMATPLTSGTMALIRQWLVDRKGINEPMAALMKALLINGARDMTPGQYGTGDTQEITARPDRSQGFGHVNLYNSLEPGSGNFLVFVTNRLNTSASFTTNIAVGRANGKYLLTLVWQDYPGSSGGSKNLVNDLDLTVTSPSGNNVYYPNNLSTNDHVNNVEFIEFTATETGLYSVKVNGYSVSKTSPHSGQPFALVMRGPATSLEETAPAFSSTAASATGTTGETFTYNFSSLLTAGYPYPTFRLHTSDSYDSFDPSTGMLSFTPAAAGSYNFTCLATNTQGSATCALTVTITPPPPAVPAGLALSDVGPISFTASWNAAANAESYSLDVATVSGSATPSALVSEDFSGCTAANSYANGSFEGDGGTWVYTNAIFAPGAAADSPGSAGRIQLKASAGYLHLPAVDNPTAFSVNMAGSAAGSLYLDQYISGSWVNVATWDISAACANFTHSFTNAGAAAQLRLHGTKALYIYDIEVSGATIAYNSLSGYPKSVSGTSTSVTGLSPSTTYAARVRSLNSGGTSDWSDWVSATTSAEDFAPVWATLPAQDATVGNTLVFTPAAYVTGSPAPTVTLESATASSGYAFADGTLSFTPSAAGTFTFTFLASNGLGTASATLTVAATEFVPTKYALCVGINTYSSGNSTLYGCVNDAAYFYTNLVIRGGWTTNHMTKLTDSGATKAAIRRAITNCAAQAVSGDTFIYQHSSHGGRNSGKSVYLCTYEDYYEDTELAEDLAKFASGVKVVIVVDACHSGGLFKASRSAEEKAAFNLAERVTALMDAARARKAARGEPVAQSISASEIGWVTAADYTESSLDGGYYDTAAWLTDPEAEGSVEGGVFLGAFTWAWWNGTGDTESGYGDNDGYADGYECWKVAHDFCTNIDRFWNTNGMSFTPQCTNVTVLRSVELGWAGNSAPATPPAFSAATSSASGFVGSPVTFDFSALLTAGSLPLTYYLPQASVASYSFNTQSGVLTFTPDATGDYTFTCTVSNAYGTATNTLTVTATLPPVTVPVLTVSDETDTTALASWTACDGVTSYTLQLASDDQFSSGGSGAAVLEADFSDTTGWTLSGTGQYTGAGYYGAGSPSIKFDGNGDYAISPDFGSGAKLQFWAYGNGGSGSTFAISGLVNGSWTDIETVTIAQGADTYEVTLPSGTSQIRFDFTKSVNCALDDVVVYGASGEGSLISTITVDGLSHTFTGLAPYTIYYARVKGDTEWSNVAEFLTDTAGDSAPVWSAIPTQNVDVGTNCWLNLADYVTGSPAQTITLVSTTASTNDYEFEDGYLLFAPPAGGTYTFDFTASNSAGSADATLTVIGHVPPVTVPELLVGDVTDTTAFATWSECTGVTAYTLQLASDNQFTTGGSGGGGETLTETFANVSFTATGSSYTDQTISGGDLGTWTATSCRGDQGTPVIRYAGTLTSPTIAAGVASVEFDYDWPFSESSTCDIELYVGGTLMGTATVTGSTAGTAIYTLDSPVAGPTTIEFLNKASSNKRIRVTEVRITTPASGSSGDGSLILETTVNTNEYTFTGLTPYTIYYARVKGDADWSNTEEFITEETHPSGTAPSWSSGFPTNWSMTAGDIDGFDVTTYVSGDPAPSVTLDTDAPAGDYDFEDGGFIYMPTHTGTFTFTFTATNDLGTANAVLVATVTGTAPAWSAAFPATATVAAGEDCEIENVSAYVSGSPSPTVVLTYASSEDCDFDNDYFLFNTATPGTYTFVFTASNVLGTADATFTVTVTGGDTPASGYEQWIDDNGYPEEPGSTMAANGHTYWENYIADIDPTSTNELAIVPDLSTGSSFTVPAASSNRYYQFIYSTNLSSGFLTNNLGTGTTNPIAAPDSSDWYGSIRVLLAEPAAP